MDAPREGVSVAEHAPRRLVNVLENSQGLGQTGTVIILTVQRNSVAEAQLKRIPTLRSEGSSRHAGLLCEEGPRLFETPFFNEGLGDR